MKKTRILLLLLALLLSVSTLFACKDPVTDDETETEENADSKSEVSSGGNTDADGDSDSTPNGSPYLPSYGDNIVDYDELA